MTVKFTVYAKPEPQGSTRAFVIKGRAVTTSTNKNLKCYRQQVSLSAVAAMNEPGAELILRKNPVRLTVAFYFSRPVSKSKKAFPTVKPDIDKLIRAVGDALTGICYADDSQIIDVQAFKFYDSPERTVIEVSQI